MDLDVAEGFARELRLLDIEIADQEVDEEHEFPSDLDLFDSLGERLDALKGSGRGHEHTVTANFGDPDGDESYLRVTVRAFYYYPTPEGEVPPAREKTLSSIEVAWLIVNPKATLGDRERLLAHEAVTRFELKEAQKQGERLSDLLAGEATEDTKPANSPEHRLALIRQSVTEAEKVVEKIEVKEKKS